MIFVSDLIKNFSQQKYSTKPDDGGSAKGKILYLPLRLQRTLSMPPKKHLKTLRFSDVFRE